MLIFMKSSTDSWLTPPISHTGWYFLLMLPGIGGVRGACHSPWICYTLLNTDTGRGPLKSARSERWPNFPRSFTGKWQVKFSKESLALLQALLRTVSPWELGGFGLMVVSMATEIPDSRYVSERIHKTSVKMGEKNPKQNEWLERREGESPLFYLSL